MIPQIAALISARVSLSLFWDPLQKPAPIFFRRQLMGNGYLIIRTAAMRNKTSKLAYNKDGCILFCLNSYDMSGK